MVGQHSEGSISWIPENSERLSFWVFLLLYIFKFYSDLRRFIMTISSSVTSLLTQQDNLLLQIATVDTELTTLQHSIKEFQFEINSLEQDRKRIAYSLWELDKALVNLLCPTDEVLRRFSGVIGALVHHDHPQMGSTARDQRWADLGFTQSSSEG
jgi:uncharacterized protein YhhL (DUF1145 family)